MVKFFSTHDDQTLDCQTCGTPLRKLTKDEAKKVAENPYNFIVFCHVCARYEEGYE